MYLIDQFLIKIYGERFSGEMVSNSKGDGYDIEDFREYMPGDNVKRINWKLSAKHDKEYISLYKVEKEPIVDVFIDYNINFSLSIQSMALYFEVLDNLFHKLGIRKNIYYFYRNGFLGKKIEYKKLNLFKEARISNKKSCINEIFEDNLFKTNHYKIIVSDFLFLDTAKLKELKPNKNFFVSVDYLTLLKNKSFPVLNGYFSYSLEEDFFENLNNIYNEIKKYGQLELLK